MYLSIGELVSALIARQPRSKLDHPWPGSCASHGDSTVMHCSRTASQCVPWFLPQVVFNNILTHIFGREVRFTSSASSRNPRPKLHFALVPATLQPGQGVQKIESKLRTLIRDTGLIVEEFLEYLSTLVRISSFAHYSVERVHCAATSLRTCPRRTVSHRRVRLKPHAISQPVGCGDQSGRQGYDQPDPHKCSHFGVGLFWRARFSGLRFHAHLPSPMRTRT